MSELEKQFFHSFLVIFPILCVLAACAGVLTWMMVFAVVLLCGAIGFVFWKEEDEGG